MLKTLVICGVLILAIGGPARSQFTQYKEPGSAAKVPEDAAEKARKGAEGARWRFGRLRMQPHLRLSNVGYIQNVFAASNTIDQIDDTHATLGTGLAGYVRLGSNSLLSGYVAPEYFWWQDSTELRELTVNSGLAWFGSFNRLNVSTSMRSTERQRPLSLEVEAPVKISTDSFDFDGTLELTRRLAIFGAAKESKVRHGGDAEQFVPELVLRDLDRDQSRLVAGLELRGSDLALGLGYETTEVDFVTTDSRDNTGEGPSVRLDYGGNRLTVAVRYSDLKISYESPLLPDTTQTIGTAVVALKLRPKTTVSIYKVDALTFTAISANGIIESENRGIDLEQGFGKQLEASVFFENGTQSFIDAQNPGRVDDLEAFGLRVRFQLRDNLALTGRLRDETWDSSLTDFDRSASAVGIGVEFGSDLLPW